MRHTSSGTITHVDATTVACFGFLPQDLIGRSIFDYYHPEDYATLKEMYETVMRMGKLTATTTSATNHSSPYRFLIQNGSYVTLDTEWTSFINPWSRQLEFILCQHRVLKGNCSSNALI